MMVCCSLSPPFFRNQFMCQETTETAITVATGKPKRSLIQKIKDMQKLQCMWSNLQKNACKYFWYYTISGNCRTVTSLCSCASYRIKNCKGS